MILTIKETSSKNTAEKYHVAAAKLWYYSSEESFSVAAVCHIKTIQYIPVAPTTDIYRVKTCGYNIVLEASNSFQTAVTDV